MPLRDSSLNGFGQVLYSRFRDTTHLALEEQAWHWLLREAREPLTPAMLRRALGRVALGEGGAAVLQRFLLESGQTRKLRERRSAAAWPAYFMRLLDRLGWPGPEPLDSLEHQQVAQFYDALYMLAELEPLEGAIDYGRALGALERICTDCVFQAQTPDAPIQVLGLLEAAGLQFDAMWICGMSASEWPAPPAPNPFIPLLLQRTAGMPHADARRELEYASRLLQRLRHSSADIIASYARLDDEITVPPSPLLADFERLEPRREAPWPEQWCAAGESVELELITETPPPRVDSQEAAGIAGGSAILADQAQCPFRAFAYHRLGARPLPSPEPALTAAQRGVLLHDALFRLWGELENSDKLKALDSEERRALSARAAGAAVEQFRGRGGQPYQAALLGIEGRRLTQLLHKWLDIESLRADFVVSDREQRHDLAMGGLTLTLRVDRVDALANGRRLLIDYKSGDAKPRHWLGERPEDPQLPLYTRLLDADELEGVSFAVLRHSEQEYRGLARSAQGPGIETDLGKATAKTPPPITEWDELQSHWNQRLEALVTEFVEGHAPVAPLNRNRTCTYCGLEALCRVR
jgi:probable DNA repair protein